MIALAFSGGKDSMACLHLMKEQLDCAIFVDTGYAYPETLELVRYAAAIVPMHVVKTDRAGQNERLGIPADVVPVMWTAWAQQVAGVRPYSIQPYIQCCQENIMAPLWLKARELGVTEMVIGQRDSEEHRSPARDGTEVMGIIRRHPIETWSNAQVLEYLAERMEIPPHYAFKHTSLDCYDCPAYRGDSLDRLEWTAGAHPTYFEAYRKRALLVDAAVRDSHIPAHEPVTGN